MDGQTDRRTDLRTDGRTNRKIRNNFFKVGKKVVFMKVALMSFFTIDGTNVVFLAIGGTYVDLIEGGTNVGRTSFGRTNVGGRKVAASQISEKVYSYYRHIVILDSLTEIFFFCFYFRTVPCQCGQLLIFIGTRNPFFRY
jgi:hypothetical protein